MACFPCHDKTYRLHPCPKPKRPDLLRPIRPVALALDCVSDHQFPDGRPCRLRSAIWRKREIHRYVAGGCDRSARGGDRLAPRNTGYADTHSHRLRERGVGYIDTSTVDCLVCCVRVFRNVYTNSSCALRTGLYPGGGELHRKCATRDMHRHGHVQSHSAGSP